MKQCEGQTVNPANQCDEGIIYCWFTASVFLSLLVISFNMNCDKLDSVLGYFGMFLSTRVTTHKKKAVMDYMYRVFFSAVNRDKVINIDFVLAVTDPV